MSFGERSRGFTLIEILVAVVIVGIVMSVAVLSLTLVSDDREVRREARRLMSLVQLAQDDAMMQGREFGVEFMTGGYRFVEFDPAANQWAEPLLDDSLKLWTLPEDYEVSLFVEDKRVELEPNPKQIEYDDRDGARRARYAPHVLVFSSGETTPFELEIRRVSDNVTVAVEGDLLGNLDYVDEDDLE